MLSFWRTKSARLLRNTFYSNATAGRYVPAKICASIRQLSSSSARLASTSQRAINMDDFPVDSIRYESLKMNKPEELMPFHSNFSIIAHIGEVHFTPQPCLKLSC